MTTARVEVTRAAPTSNRSVGDALADAFRDDPVFGWLIPPDAPNREQRMVTFFRSMARSYLRRNKHVYQAGDGLGGALWSAPGSWALPWGEIVRETPSTTKAFGASLLRALRTQLQVESLHPKEPQHWYLAYLGVRCDAQGRGIGSALLTEVLAKADTEAVPAYLESSNERNLSLYQRHGFKIVGELKALDRGPTIWRMWRDPER
jgi:ribosomal protein S18 acetylase RimI-like enzyme